MPDDTSLFPSDTVTSDDQPTVEAPELGPAQELIRELIPPLDEDDAKALCTQVLEDYHGAIVDRSEWESRMGEWEDAYYNRVEPKTFPWPGSANFHVPLTMMGVETFKPRLIEGVTGEDPPIVVIAVKTATEERRELVEMFLNWRIKTRLPMDELVATSAHLYLQPGLVIAKTYWKVTRKVRRLVREFSLDATMEDITTSFFGAQVQPLNLKPVGDQDFEGTVPVAPGAGEPLRVRLKLKILDDGVQVLLEKDELDEGSWIDLVDPLDFFAPSRAGGDVQQMPWCQHRLWLYDHELRNRVAIGRFEADAVEMLLQGATAPEGSGETDSYEVHTARELASAETSDGPTDARQLQYEVIEDHRRWDINGDGEEEEIITWVAPALKDRILGWDYLDNVYAHGRRPFRVGRFLPVPFTFYPLSYAEMIHGVQDEINAIHNQRSDFGTIQNLPFYFYRASATHPPIGQPLRPGAGVPIDNPQQDLFFPSWRGSPAYGVNDEATLLQYHERLSGLTDLSFGKQPTRVGATRTARGTQTLLAESGLRFKTILQGFQTFWAGIFSDILALEQEYLPPETEFRVTGRLPAVIKIKDRTELQGQYDIRIALTMDQLNRGQMREDTVILLQTLLTPLAIQTGVIGQRGIRQLYRDFLKAFGKDPRSYLEATQDFRTPEEELMLLATGQYVAPNQGENLQAHLTAHQAHSTMEGLTPQARRLLQRHMQETYQLAQLQQTMQMMQQMQGPRGASQGAMGAGSSQPMNAMTGAIPQGTPPGMGGGEGESTGA